MRNELHDALMTLVAVPELDAGGLLKEQARCGTRWRTRVRNGGVS